MSVSLPEVTHVRVSEATRDRINNFDDDLTQEQTIAHALDLLEENQG